MKRTIITLAVIFIASVSQVSAASFDLITISNIDTLSQGTAAGTSNGVGWTLSGTGTQPGTFIWSALTYTGENYTGFSEPSRFTTPLDFSDTLHIGYQTFDLTFDQVIGSALVYISDNPSPPTDGRLDFGITPTIISGDINVSGTTFWCGSSAGGLVLLENINSNILTHTSPGTGGLTFAIVATPVPLPSTLLLTGPIALILIALFRRKKTTDIKTFNDTL